MSPQERRHAGRRFGLTVGGAFLVLALVTWWRGAETAATILAAVGALLVASGLAVPARLGPIERAWMTLGHALSRITTPIVLAVMYFGIMTPIGIVRRLARDPLRHAERDGGFWQRRADGGRSDLRRQF